MLTFIVLACSINVSVPDEDNQGCKIFEQPILEDGRNWTPMTCMMQSPIMVVKFHEQHPGWQVKKWSCRYHDPSQDI